LGFIALVSLLALLWLCCFKRGRKTFRRKDEKNADISDDDELEGWRAPPGETAYVTRIESWHEPAGARGSRTSLNRASGPPKGSQSRVSMVQRDIPDRYSSPQTTQTAVPPPHRLHDAPKHNSQYGLIQNENPFDDPQTNPTIPYADGPERRSMDDSSRNAAKYPGYTPYRSSQSSQTMVDRKPVPSQSIPDRTPTPLFGSGKTPGETLNRQDYAAPQQSYGNNRRDSANGNGQWLPPRNPGRRRESVPGSPLAHEFDFDFQDRARKDAARRTSSGTSGNSVYQDAHHRF